jgi:D-glycero-alpha-D-manno-heptose 1-phosphate guanylyltransferase
MAKCRDVPAIVLAGGLGTRLRSEVSHLPKVLAPVNGHPFLDFLLRKLREFGVSTCILATGHLHQKVFAQYGDNYGNIELQYSVETEPLGTGGAIRKALARVDTPEVLVVNGDTFFDLKLDALRQYHQNSGADLTIALKPMQQVSRYGTVKLEGGRLVSFEPKRSLVDGLINGGVYMLKSSLFEGIQMPLKFSFEEDFLKKFVALLNIAGFVSHGYFIDIGIPEDYQRAQSELVIYE